MPCAELQYEFRYARHPRTCVFILQAVSNYFLHSFLIMTIELGWCTNLSQSTIHVQKLDFISPLHLGQCPSTGFQDVNESGEPQLGHVRK